MQTPNPMELSEGMGKMLLAPSLSRATSTKMPQMWHSGRDTKAIPFITRVMWLWTPQQSPAGGVSNRMWIIPGKEPSNSSINDRYMYLHLRFYIKINKVVVLPKKGGCFIFLTLLWSKSMIIFYWRNKRKRITL